MGGIVGGRHGYSVQYRCAVRSWMDGVCDAWCSGSCSGAEGAVVLYVLYRSGAEQIRVLSPPAGIAGVVVVGVSPSAEGWKPLTLALGKSWFLARACQPARFAYPSTTLVMTALPLPLPFHFQVTCLCSRIVHLDYCVEKMSSVYMYFT